MDIIAKFGYRTYVFHEKKDITRATSIYAHTLGDLDCFENEMEREGINFEYELNP